MVLKRLNWLPLFVETNDQPSTIIDAISTKQEQSGIFWILQNRQQDAYEGLKQDFVKYSEEKNNLNLDYNNQLAKLQTKLDDSNSQAAQWDAEWNHIKSTAAHKTLMLGQYTSYHHIQTNPVYTL